MSYIDKVSEEFQITDRRTRYAKANLSPRGELLGWTTYEENELPQELIDSGFLEQNFAESYDKKYTDTKWRPNAYTAFVDDIGLLVETVDKIRHAGFSVDNEYLDVSHILNVETSLKRTMTMISAGVFLVVTIGYMLLQYLQKDAAKRFLKYLYLNGFRKAGRTEYTHTRLARRTVSLALSAVILYSLIRIILIQTHTAFIRIDPVMYLGIIVVCAGYEYVLPKVLERI